MKRLFLAAGLAACALISPAAAAPLAPASTAVDAASLVEQVQGYGYRRDCVWINNGWGYRSGGKVLVCRPYRPAGGGWSWHNEGNKHGWYHAKKKSWHHK